MSNKRYILTLVETESDRAYSALLSRTKGILLVLSLFLVFFLIALPFSSLFRQTTTNLQFERIKHENTELKKKFSNWEKRIRGIESDLSTLYQTRSEIQVASNFSVPEPALGVGGPESETRLELNPAEAVIKTELNLNNLESDLTALRENMENMEQSITSRMERIAHYPSIRPVNGGWISSGFGKRIDPFTEAIEQHSGIDISIDTGTKISATAAGVVKVVNNEVVENKGFGKYVIIDHGYGYETLYAHLSKTMVKQGQKVKRLDVIGLSGNTGKSTAPHIHYHVSYNGILQNPINFIL